MIRARHFGIFEINIKEGDMTLKKLNDKIDFCQREFVYTKFIEDF
jgi:hypothetical protein